MHTNLQTQRLVVNPFASVQTELSDGGIQMILCAPKKGKRLELLVRSFDRELMRILIELLENRGQILNTLLSENQIELLKSAGVLVPEDQVPQAVRFQCFLDEQPTDLVPYHRYHGEVSDGSPKEVHANLQFFCAAEVPWLLPAYFPHFNLPAIDQPLALVKDSGTEMVSCYVLRGHFRHVVPELVAGTLDPGRLAPDVARPLVLANMLVSKTHVNDRRREWDRIRTDAHAKLGSQGYAVLRDLLHPLHLGALRAYFRNLVAEGHMVFGDKQVPLRYNMHDEPVARILHVQFADLVSRIVGKPVKPSYSYTAVYQPGSVLQRHLDRAQCEWSLSFAVDYSPENQSAAQDRAEAWPLVLEQGRWFKRATAIRLAMGDGVLYQGRRMAHYRDALPEGCSATFIFFHYVPQNFVGSLY